MARGGSSHGQQFGEHGSWNRDVLNGYKVVCVPFGNGKPNEMAQDVVTGFLNSDNQARGRPVGVAIDKSGALLIADDVGNTVWRVSSARPEVTQR
jgi:glucose/arabinose dehydrogenase